MRLGWALARLRDMVEGYPHFPVLTLHQVIERLEEMKCSSCRFYRRQGDWEKGACSRQEAEGCEFEVEDDYDELYVTPDFFCKHWEARS